MSDLDSYAFEPGQQVQCKTRYDDVFKGEVVAFDLNSKILILKSPSSSNPSLITSTTTPGVTSTSASATTPATTTTITATNTNHDLHCLVLDSVSEVDILEEPQGKIINDLPNLTMKYIQSKLAAASSERLRLVEAVGNGVSQDGISLYTALLKMYDRATDITWKDKVKIVVLNSVVISPPYKEANCELLNPKTKRDAVNYVKTYVRKFWDSYSEQKVSQPTASVTSTVATATAT